MQTFGATSTYIYQKILLCCFSLYVRMWCFYEHSVPSVWSGWKILALQFFRLRSQKWKTLRASLLPLAPHRRCGERPNAVHNNIGVSAEILRRRQLTAANVVRIAVAVAFVDVLASSLWWCCCYWWRGWILLLMTLLLLMLLLFWAIASKRRFPFDNFLFDRCSAWNSQSSFLCTEQACKIFSFFPFYFRWFLLSIFAKRKFSRKSISKRIILYYNNNNNFIASIRRIPYVLG